jgi:hypothetical protein
MFVAVQVPKFGPIGTFESRAVFPVEFPIIAVPPSVAFFIDFEHEFSFHDLFG